MDLTFDIAWEVMPPADGKYVNSKIPADAFEQFVEILTRTANRTGDPEEVFYVVRAEFSKTMGQPVYRSTSLYFAPGDARMAMERAADNAPLFIAALYSVCKKIKKQFGSRSAPSVPAMNKLLEIHRLGYIIQPPNLILRDQIDVVPVQPSAVLEQAHARFREAIDRSHQLLEEGKGDEAVALIWWLLESIVLSFSGCKLNGQEITGSYFNEIVKSLRRLAEDSVPLGAISRWLETLQSYLSGPKEAGIRHGRQLHMEGLKKHEAELFCNLARSYITYLLSEYEVLTTDPNRSTR